LLVAVLAVKALLAPTFVVGASLTARRFGPWLGGVVGGLPVVAGPIVLIYALVHGRSFAQHAAAGTLLGMLSLTAFVVVYGRLARRARWSVCMLVGWAAFALATIALDGVGVSAGVAFALDLAGFGLGLLLLPGSLSDDDAPVVRPSWDLPLRAGCALVLVLTLTTISGRLGPQLSGLLAPFPVITTVLSTFTHTQRGAAETVRLLRGMLTGFVAFALFFLILTITLGAWDTPAAFLVATVAVLIIQGAVISLARRSPAAVSCEASS
jgi:hypothetical protein